jgi:hypothetical protein
MDPKARRQKYRVYTDDSKKYFVPVYARGWWLDLVCGEDNWDVALVENGEGLLGALPYTIRKDAGFTVLTQSSFCRAMGPILFKEPNKYAKRISQQKDVMNALIEALPSFQCYSQNWDRRITNWLPFYWNQFSQSTRYTYVINDLNDFEEIWGRFLFKTRTDIRKAKKQGIAISAAVDDFDRFHRILGKTFENIQSNPAFDYNLMVKLYEECTKRGCGKIFLAEDTAENVHAGMFLVWDERSAYYLYGGNDAKLRNSGAISYLIWEAIKFSASLTKNFDFVGSMLGPVERHFRGFGGELVPYYHVSKSSSSYKVYRKIMEAMGK